jgi:hypothetical protein
MELATNFVLLCACILVAWGSLGIAAAWLAPALRESPLLGKKMFTGGLERTRENFTLVSICAITFGVFLASGVLQYRLVFWVSFALLVPLGYWLMQRGYKPTREA